MRLLDFSASTVAENLAIDEAILEEAELLGSETPELLRLWEMPTTCVILGRSSKAEVEVNMDAVRRDGIPVMRRSSGGATVVAGPGCLMYSVLLSYEKRPYLRNLNEAHREVMEKLVEAIQPYVPEIDWDGTCDLTLEGRKLSGNALRCRLKYLLYHGTFLLGFPISSIEHYLLEPPRQPDYRLKRKHADFVTSLPMQSDHLRRRLIEVWGANDKASLPSPQFVEKLLQERYSNPEWHRVP